MTDDGFEGVYEEFFPVLMEVAVGHGLSVDEAAELTEDVLVGALCRPARLDREASLMASLLGAIEQRKRG